MCGGVEASNGVAKCQVQVQVKESVLGDQRVYRSACMTCDLHN